MCIRDSLRRVLLEPVVRHIALVPVPEGLRSDGPVHQTVLVWSTVEDFTVLITTSFVEHQDVYKRQQARYDNEKRKGRYVCKT